MKIYIVFVLALYPMLLCAQKAHQSYLYNDKGQLLIDTSFCITNDQLIEWKEAEKEIISEIVHSISYPPIASENDIAGKVIIRFVCDTFEIKNISIINRSKNIAPLEESAIQGFKKATKYIHSTLTRNTTITHTERIKHGVGAYYIVLDFSILPYKQFLEKNKGTIPIIVISDPFYDR